MMLLSTRPKGNKVKQEDFEIIELLNENQFFALALAEEIKQIARPLSLLGISYFNQIRIFKDGSRISLGTHAEWLKHFHEQKYYLSGQFSREGYFIAHFQEKIKNYWLSAQFKNKIN